MPLGAMPGHERERGRYTHLEAVARSLAGLSPWLELDAVPQAEADAQRRFRGLARRALEAGLDPASADALNFRDGAQPLVDSAFLAYATLHAPQELWAKLDPLSRDRLIDAWRSTRAIKPAFSNWLLFSAVIEAALFRFAGECDRMRIDYALRQHEQWYVGDGAYGDGPEFQWDYYNSFVIHPLLLAVLDAGGDRDEAWGAMRTRIDARARRFAAVLERMVAPDGSFPPLGRSLTYRCGAFHHLALMALRRQLPEEVRPAGARVALDAVIRRTLSASENFDSAGWLRPGLCAHQPDLAESYISTGSLYLCTTAFLPLGLPESEPFWSAPDELPAAWRLWAGGHGPADHALRP